MRTPIRNVRIDDELWAKAKKAAGPEGVGVWIRELIRKATKKQ